MTAWRTFAAALFACTPLWALGCGNAVGPRQTLLTFSFEQGMEGWSAAAADTGPPHAPWSIERSGDLAYAGQEAVKFYVANYTDAAKIWMVRPFSGLPGRSYDIEVSYAFATADYGSINHFVLLTGIFETPPTDGPSLTAGTVQEDTGNGAHSNVGYRWLRKNARASVQAPANGMLFVVVGIWGTWEGGKTYYLDDVAVQLTPK